jgi:hypothetical protein
VEEEVVVAEEEVVETAVMTEAVAVVLPEGLRVRSRFSFC